MHNFIPTIAKLYKPMLESLVLTDGRKITDIPEVKKYLEKIYGESSANTITHTITEKTIPTQKAVDEKTEEKPPVTSIIDQVSVINKAIIRSYLNEQHPPTKRFIDGLSNSDADKLADGLSKIQQVIPEKYRGYFCMNTIDSSKPATIDEFTLKGYMDAYTLHCKYNTDTMKYDCVLY